MLFPDVPMADTVVIPLAKEAMPIVGAGLFITAITAAVMSTVSAYLNAGSAILEKDIYRRFIRRSKDDGHYLLVARLFTVVIAVAARVFSASAARGKLGTPTVTALACSHITQNQITVRNTKYNVRQSEKHSQKSIWI